MRVLMSNSSLLVVCTIAQEQRVESIILISNKKWRSPPGGWLPVQQGIWEQSTTMGVLLRNNDGSGIALLAGLLFPNAAIGENGTFRYDIGGDAGKWTITEQNPEL